MVASTQWWQFKPSSQPKAGDRGEKGAWHGGVWVSRFQIQQVFEVWSCSGLLHLNLISPHIRRHHQIWTLQVPDSRLSKKAIIHTVAKTHSNSNNSPHHDNICRHHQPLNSKASPLRQGNFRSSATSWRRTWAIWILPWVFCKPFGGRPCLHRLRPAARTVLSYCRSCRRSKKTLGGAWCKWHGHETIDFGEV